MLATQDGTTVGKPTGSMSGVTVAACLGRDIGAARYRSRYGKESGAMIIATTEEIAGHRITETKGEVFGLVVRSRGLGGNIAAGLRSLGGGEIKEYTEMLEDTRRQALDRMTKNATAMGANAVVRMQFDSSELGQTMSEVVAYGTAVIVEQEG